MKNFYSFITSALFVMLAVVSCDKYDDTEIRQRLDKLEGSTISTINQQISAIENTIAVLQKSDTVFASEIKTLRTYVDECRNSDKSWVETTFATIAQYNSIMDSLSKMNVLIGTSIDAAVISMQSWVNQALTGYYDIAIADAKLSALGARITQTDSISNARMLSLQDSLCQAKTDLTDAYKKAISDAIETNNGTISNKIADKIATVNTHIDTEINRVDLAMAELEGRINALETTVAELTKVLRITFSDNNVSCSAGDIVKIGYTIINSNGHATVYTLDEKGYSATVETKTDTTGTITVCAPNPLVNGNILVFVSEDNKSAIASLNFIKGSMTISTDVVEIGAAGGNVSIDVDTELGYMVKVQDGITWLHNATITTRSVMRHESITLTADASQLAFPRNAVVYILNASGDVLSQYTVRQAGTVSSHEFVDLGLSVKWATCNIGASRPEEYGDYFAWGAIEPWYLPGYAQTEYGVIWKSGRSDGYSEVNIPYYVRNEITAAYQYTKYLGNTESGYKHPSATDEDALKTVLDSEDDAAYMNWGGTWRMPTVEEFDELIVNCTWVWYGDGNLEFGGMAGYKVVSKMDGFTDKWVFLPAAGGRDNVNLNYAGSYGNYWSSSLSTSNSNNAYGLYFGSDNRLRNFNIRYYGQSVRPVCP